MHSSLPSLSMRSLPSLIAVVLLAQPVLADEAARQAGMVAAMKPAERSQEDQARDALEKPQAIADLAGLRQGMRIADLHAGDGYVTEVLMRNVLPYGKTFANNDPSILSEQDRAAWEKRLESPDAADLAELQNPLSAPLPFYAKPLEAVFSVGDYHQTVQRGLDRRAIHQAVFDSLVSGGVYIIADARAAKGAGDADAAALCRTRSELVKQEVEAVGFRLVTESDALANAAAGNTSSACDAKAAPDRFLLKFERPHPEAAQ